MVFLCETKIHDSEFHKKLCFQIGFPKSEAMFSIVQSGGLAIFWKKDIDVCFRSKSHHHIDVLVDYASSSLPTWRFTGFYSHPTRTERYRSWSLLRDVSDEHSLPWVVMGDFNELLHAHEKMGGRRRTK